MPVPNNNSLDSNMFHASSAPNPGRPETEPHLLNTNDLSGWDVNMLSPVPSFTAMQGPWGSSLHHVSSEHESASQSSGAPSSYDEDSPEAWTVRLAALATRATQTAKHLAPSDASSTPLTVSSPQVDDIFDATSTLLCILDTVSSGAPLHVASSRSPGSASELAPAELTRDPGLVFLVLACHQRLLDTFHAMCGSIRRSLYSMSSSRAQQQKQQHHGTLPRKRTLHDEGLPCVAQFAMVLQLISHLLNQLDRALNPCPSPSLPPGVPDLGSFRHYVEPIDPDSSSSWARSPPGTSENNEGDTALLLSGQEAAVSKRPEGRQGFVGLARGFLMKVPEQHTTLSNQIRELQESISQVGRL